MTRRDALRDPSRKVGGLIRLLRGSSCTTFDGSLAQT